MAEPLAEKAFAKVNLTLRVLGRRDDGYHTLESLVAFADLADTLTLQPGGALALDVSGPFATSSGKPANNLVLKAASALGKYIEGLKAGHFLLEKNIPVAAGLGGGSADAAAALRLLARANDLSLDDARLMVAALEVGADVPVCLTSQACIMRGLGERLSPPLRLPPLHMVLVNPGVALATRDVFAKFGNSFDTCAEDTQVPRASDALIEWLSRHDNDLTPAAVGCAPVVADVLKALRAEPGVLLARMSGSGATCFALYATASEAAAAASVLQTRYENWWIVPATIG